ncbi:cyclin-domain-containing protein [Pilobolus umbonatus]|nr:cyclin-domain-containing protein [Pilobolus umbonatus]
MNSLNVGPYTIDPCFDTLHSNTCSTSLQTDPDLYSLRNIKTVNNTNYSIVDRKVLLDTKPPPIPTTRLAYVEALVDINALVIESIWPPSIPKESRVSPVVPLRTFIQEVLKRSRTTYSTLQTALFYLFRAQPVVIQYLQNNNHADPCDVKKTWQHNAYISCGRRMFLASLVVASKFVQDKTYRNSAWAKIAGLPVTEINIAERYFLNIIDYRLYIDQPTFDRWHRLLHYCAQGRIHNIPTSLRDLSCLSFDPISYPPSPIMSPNYDKNSHHLTDSSFATSPSLSSCSCTRCSTSSIPPALSLSSSISSSPAQTPTQISPVRASSFIKRKREYEDASVLDKKHCRFWQ